MSLRLPPRLEALARHVLPGVPAADIGTDHGLLAVHLVLTDHVPRVIAVDKAPAALDRARHKVATWNVGHRVELRLGDGLSVLRPADDVHTVILAGLGGRTVTRIMKQDREATASLRRLVVQVNRGGDRLPQALAALGWQRLTTEQGPEQRWPWRIEVFERAR